MLLANTETNDIYEALKALEKVGTETPPVLDGNKDKQDENDRHQKDYIDKIVDCTDALKALLAERFGGGKGTVSSYREAVNERAKEGKNPATTVKGASAKDQGKK